jgi:hypothetical protein
MNQGDHDERVDVPRAAVQQDRGAEGGHERGSRSGRRASGRTATTLAASQGAAQPVAKRPRQQGDGKSRAANHGAYRKASSWTAAAGTGQPLRASAPRRPVGVRIRQGEASKVQYSHAHGEPMMIAASTRRAMRSTTLTAGYSRIPHPRRLAHLDSPCMRSSKPTWVAGPHGGAWRHHRIGLVNLIQGGHPLDPSRDAAAYWNAGMRLRDGEPLYPLLDECGCLGGVPIARGWPGWPWPVTFLPVHSRGRCGPRAGRRQAPWALVPLAGARAGCAVAFFARSWWESARRETSTRW